MTAKLVSLKLTPLSTAVPANHDPLAAKAGVTPAPAAASAPSMSSRRFISMDPSTTRPEAGQRFNCREHTITTVFRQLDAVAGDSTGKRGSRSFFRLPERKVTPSPLALRSRQRASL